ncbi:hypothetical protein [Olleya sp. HaHaR_3_96]|uniref:hypothetical protein n=1 Tax=Olleya sp. HaHaR_3_96 TaxID=2745560 RepID=UPI001C4F8129|nr:hypothetical protein [Olleya sp. HaHaR_3_96]QXP58743.1 hypothetical protein H0I26_12570 [Olleya sp. HaHaR_3_96]
MTNNEIKEKLDKAKNHFKEYLINKPIMHKGNVKTKKRAKYEIDLARTYIYRIFDSKFCYELFETNDSVNDPWTITALIDDLKSGDGFEYTYTEIRNKGLERINKE